MVQVWADKMRTLRGGPCWRWHPMHVLVRVLLALFLTQVSVYGLDEQWRMDQVPGTIYTHVGESEKSSWLPVLVWSAQLWPLRLLRKGTNEWETSLCLLFSVKQIRGKDKENTLPKRDEKDKAGKFSRFKNSNKRKEKRVSNKFSQRYFGKWSLQTYGEETKVAKLACLLVPRWVWLAKDSDFLHV